MGFLKRSISVTGTEQEFIEKVAEVITGFDSGIVCETDIAAEFADTANTPTITFKVGNIGTFKLVRSAVLSTTTSTYKLYVTINGTDVVCNSNGFGFSPNSPSSTAIIERAWNMYMIGTSNALLIGFQGYSDTAGITSSNSTAVKALLFKASDNNITDYGPNSAAAFSNLYTIDSGTRLSVNNSYAFACEDNKILYSTGKIFLNYNSKIYTAKADSSMIDCSNVTQNSIVTLDGKNYFALTANTLIEV